MGRVGRYLFHFARCTEKAPHLVGYPLCWGIDRRLLLATSVRFGSLADIAAALPNVALPPKADLTDHRCHVRFVPEADITSDIQ
jgi:hypothetical protein